MLAAPDVGTRDRRLLTVTTAPELDPIPIDTPVAEAWAAHRVSLRDAGLRMPVNDSWIAATALALDVPVITRDDDYPAFGQLRVIKA